MCFGKRLEKLRKNKNIKQSELAELLNCTQQNISSYENGKNMPTVETIGMLAKLLEVTSDFLLYGEISNDKLSDEQKELLKVYGKIPGEKKKHATEILRTFIESEDEE